MRCWGCWARRLHEAGDIRPTNRLPRKLVDPDVSLMHVILVCEGLAPGSFVYGSLWELGCCSGVADGHESGRVSVAASSKDSPRRSVGESTHSHNI